MGSHSGNEVIYVGPGASGVEFWDSCSGKLHGHCPRWRQVDLLAGLSGHGACKQHHVHPSIRFWPGQPVVRQL